MPQSPSSASARERSAIALQRAAGQLGTAAIAGMDAHKAWFRDLTAEDRSWVGMIVQAGISEFIRWFGDHPDSWDLTTETDSTIASQVFGAAPRTLTGVITLEQTVELVRLTIDVVEQNLDHLLDPELALVVHEGLLRYGRELAFATAEVYARAAESRGAWDARLEALIVDSVLRSDSDDALLSRAGALGWGQRTSAGRDGPRRVVVVLGLMPDGSTITVFDDVRRSARSADMDALCAVQGDRMVVILGGVADPRDAATLLLDHFGTGPVVYGHVAEGLAHAHSSATAAMSGYRVSRAWPQAPVPVAADDLLPERALDGDADARRHLVEQVYLPLVESRGALLETLEAWFGHGRSVEATARALFVHPNTIRYRLRQVADLTQLSPAQPREAQTLSFALICGRLDVLTDG